jgi:uncharacterized protein involved in exopolysaccharide biosynthesis
MKGSETSSRRTLEAILRHPLQLLLIILLPIVIGGGVTYRSPLQYQATAMLWALHKYETLTATSVDSLNLDTPADTQATALSELLQTRSFSLAVAQEALFAETPRSQGGTNLQSADTALAADISQHVLVQTQGYDLFTISYTATNPQIAQQVVAAVIDNYGRQSQLIVVKEEQSLLETYQTQLSQAQLAAQSALTAYSQYVLHSPLVQSQLQIDPQYQHLQVQARQAQRNLENVQASIDTLKQDIATHRIIAASLYKVLDAPDVPSQPVSRKKTLLLGAGAGLAIALIASVLFIALMVRRDRRVYTSSDLHKVTTYPIVMELPRLSAKTVSILVKTPEDPTPLASNGRVSV